MRGEERKGGHGEGRKGPKRGNFWEFELVLWESGFIYSIISLFTYNSPPALLGLPRASRHSCCLIFSTSGFLGSLTQQDLHCSALSRLMLDS